MYNLKGILGLSLMMGAMTEHNREMFREAEAKKNKPIKKVIPKNHKEFTYKQGTLTALNQKNADKKAKKKGWDIL